MLRLQPNLHDYQTHNGMQAIKLIIIGLGTVMNILHEAGQNVNYELP